MFMLINNKWTTEGGGLAVKSIIPSGLECGGPRFESCNGKRPIFFYKKKVEVQKSTSKLISLWAVLLNFSKYKRI